jgi:hypothetical protein
MSEYRREITGRLDDYYDRKRDRDGQNGSEDVPAHPVCDGRMSRIWWDLRCEHVVRVVRQLVLNVEKESTRGKRGKRGTGTGSCRSTRSLEDRTDGRSAEPEKGHGRG